MKEEKIGGHGSWFYRHQQHGDMERRQPGGVLRNQKKGRRLGEHRRQPASQPANQPSGVVLRRGARRSGLRSGGVEELASSWASELGVRIA